MTTLVELHAVVADEGTNVGKFDARTVGDVGA